MRDIKFKVWDTEYKEFSNWTNRDPFFDVSTGKLFFWERVRKEDGSYSGDIILEDLSGRFVLQQFTGVCDKNGKEIYEGDIVSFFINAGFDNTWNEIQEVKWWKHSWVCFDGFGHFPYEVIGNIFENPELLSK